jgi:hypothetical protein
MILRMTPLITFAAFAASAAAGQQHVDHGPGAAEHLGRVHFVTTCSPAVSGRFDRAVALLHSFEFGSAIKGFNDVLATDSTCAMAYWGIALSQWSNPMAAGKRPAAFLEQGQQAAQTATRLGSLHASPRERDWIGAAGQLFADYAHTDQATRVAAYEHAMNEIASRYPADTEALIFHAIALVAAAPPTDKTYRRQLEAGRILEALWAVQPDHPGLAHYIIHAYDVPPLAERARAAAQRYAAIAPSAPHALHMPSHIFTRLGLWQASIDANTRSLQAALSSGAFAEALHAADYAMYARLQLGQDQEAKAILDTLPALTARFDPSAITGAAPPAAGVFAIAAIPARWVLERSAWTEAAALEPHPSAYPHTEAMTYFARALGAVHTGDLVNAHGAIDSLAAIERRLSASGEAYWAEQVAIQQLGAQAWIDWAEHRPDDALARMRQAADREDATEKNAVTPGPLAPARELLGDLLMELGRPTEAAAEYRTSLKREPNRRHALLRLGRRVTGN